MRDILECRHLNNYRCGMEVSYIYFAWKHLFEVDTLGIDARRSKSSLKQIPESMLKANIQLFPKHITHWALTCILCNQPVPAQKIPAKRETFTCVAIINYKLKSEVASFIAMLCLLHTIFQINYSIKTPQRCLGKCRA